ncbi:MAG: hypothetical protein AAGL17_08155 [Cyanobacteria bacterium J06576_12]
MTQTVLPQLQEIEAELTSQEQDLTTQLAEVQEKLAGIRAVLPMFSGDTDSRMSVAAESDDSLEDSVETTTAKKTASKKTTTARKAASKQTTTAKKKTPAKTTTAKTTARKKKDGRTASWQKYTRPGVKNESIPDAVRLILETQPYKEFKIAEVMDSLFKEGMPKSQYLKARNRISNVLSGGVRAGDWYKGARGTYRMTAA